MKFITNSNLLALQCVMHTGNISAAAAKLGISQANLSKIITASEKAFGNKIIDRDQRPLKITPFGQSLLPYIENCLREHNEMQDYITGHQLTKKGRVSIYSPTTLQAYLAENILPEITKLHPEIVFSMTTSNPFYRQYIDGVDFDDACDVMISYTPSINRNLVNKHLCSLRMNIYSTDECYKQNPIEKISDIENCPFILVNSMAKDINQSVINVTDIETSTAQSIQIKGNVLFDNLFTAIELCKKNHGYMIGHPFLFSRHNTLKPRLPENYTIIIDCYLIYRPRKHLPVRTQVVIDYIIKNMLIK